MMIPKLKGSDRIEMRDGLKRTKEGMLRRETVGRHLGLFFSAPCYSQPGKMT